VHVADASALRHSGYIANYYEYHFLYVTGIEHVESRSIQGATLLKLFFHEGTNMSQAVAETVAQVNRSRAFMPPGTLPPFVVRFDGGSVPVGYLMFSSDTRSLGEIQDLALNSLDMKTRSMLVELDANNPKQSLAPGMFAEVQWPVSRAQASLFVPRTAVVRTSERQFVVRVRNGVAEWVDVRRGELNGDVIEVFGDLREGDIVIRRGNDEIRPGTKIATTAAEG
jgi:hypothetical protein